VHLRRTGSYNHPVQAELFDILHNQFLPGTGTHKLVFTGYGNCRKALNKLYYLRDVYHASDVRTAIADIHTYFRLHASTSSKNRNERSYNSLQVLCLEWVIKHTK
jgi:hypothetical protein